MNLFDNIEPYSYYGGQDFMWVAEYLKGAPLFEFENNGHANDFYDIEKDKLLRFGMVGHGCKLYYDIFSGVFHFNKKIIEVVYKTDSEEYWLTGQPYIYNDIIQFKQAYSTFDPNRDFYNTNGAVNSYNFGYKSKLNIKGVKFSYKAILTIPLNEPVYINFRLVSDKDLDGRLIIKSDGLKAYEYEAPLKKGIGGELNWVIR